MYLVAQLPESPYYCFYYAYKGICWAEDADSPDLAYLYSWAGTLRRILTRQFCALPSSSRLWPPLTWPGPPAGLFSGRLPRLYGRLAIQEASRHPDGEFMVLITRLNSLLFSTPVRTRPCSVLSLPG